MKERKRGQGVWKPGFEPWTKVCVGLSNSSSSNDLSITKEEVLLPGFEPRTFIFPDLTEQPSAPSPTRSFLTTTATASTTRPPDSL